MTKAEIIVVLKEQITRETGLRSEEIDLKASFHSLGLDSISCVYVMDRLEKRLQVELNPIVFWDYPTVELLSEHLLSLKTNG
jgi:acyl carrier protein